ncbi:MAG: hypothetical protein J1E98_07045 [Lachnospiraceae bacterium]|nr:hypothetical protein [Lachnospiraceae bacterium]
MGLPGIGSGMGDVENVEQRTEDEFASGQVAWELAHGTDGGGWGQNLAGDEIDKHPHFTDAPDKELPTTPVYRVTLKAPSKGINETIYVDPETDINLEQDRYKLEYPAKWYVVDENGDGVLDDEGLPMEFNGDVTNHDVDAVGGERIFFAGENETVTVTGTYNPVEPTLTLDLDGYMKYAEGGPSAAGRFEYEITGGNETLNAELGEDGNTLTIPESTDVGVYTLTVNAHEKKPFIAPLALGAFDTKDVLLTFNVEIIKANPVIVIKPKASDVVDYGSVLSDSKLTDGEARHPTAGTVVEGIFTWTSGDTKPTVNEAAITGYPVTFIPTDTKNYNNASAYVTLTVNKVDPEHVKPPKPINSTYNGMAEALIEAGYADGGVMKYWLTDDSEAVPDENAEFSYTIPSRANAGTYYIWYKVIGDENHNDTEPKRVEATISPCELKIPAQRVAYNGRNTFTLALEGVKVDGEDSSRTVIATLIAESKDTGNYAYAEKAGEGKYTVTISNSNYIVDAKNAGTLTIDPLPVVLQWEGPLTFAFKENVTHKVTAKVTNGIEGDTFTLAYKNNTNVNVGNYTAQVIDLGNENYTLENGQNVTQKWYILKELKDIKFNPPDHITYGEPLTLKVEITEKFGLENTDKVRFYIGNRKEDVLIDLKTGVATWVIPDAESEHGFSVGRIAVYAEYLGNENEEVVESFASTITVEPKTITATIKGDNTTKTYDKNMIATGLELDFGPDGVEDCDIGNVTVSADSYTYNSYLVTDANTITANHVTLSGVQSGNYTVEVQSIDGKIEPKVVKLEWRGVSDRVYDGNPSNVTATATELIPGDDDECFVEVSGGSEINAGGPYTAKAEKLSDPNYVLPGDGTTTVTYQIDPAPLYIPEKTVKYNRKSEFDVELYGVTLADGTPEIVPAKLFTSSADVGSYDYAGEEAGSRSTASEDSRYTAREDSQNYRIANGATLTIEKVDPTYIPPVAKKLKYNGSAQELVEAGSTEDGTMEYSLSADGPWYVDLPAGIEIGTYVVWYRVVGDKNHNDSVPQFVEATIDKEAPSSDPIDPDPTDPKKPSKTKKPGNTTDTSNPTDSSNPDNMISPGDTTKNPDSTQSLGSLLKTGDEMNIALWVILLLLSLAGIMVALLYEKKIKLFSSKDRCMK